MTRPVPPFTAVVGPVVIAHRGGSLEAPENTLASVRHGVATGADWQEIEVGLTADERVPSLDEALAVPGARLMIELERSERPQRLADRVVEAVYRAGAAHRVALGSFDIATLWAAHDRDPSLPLIGMAGAAEEIEPLLQLPLSVLAVRDELAVAALEASPPTLAVWAWTVHDAAAAQGLIELGVHGLITDAPTAVLAAVRPPINPVLAPSD